MRTIGSIVFIMLLAVMSATAQESPIGQLYKSILGQSSGGGVPTFDEINNTVNETTVRALSVAEVTELLPLARQCIQSARPELREAGFSLFLAVDLRFDSAELLEPYIDDFGRLLDGTGSDTPLRRGVFFILGSMSPKLPSKAIAVLNAHLEDSRNSTQETITIAASLLEALPADAPTLHKILLVVANRSDSDLTNTVIRTLGLTRSRLPEAMDYIAANLNQKDVYLRTSAVDAASRLDKDKKALFFSKLNQIASDPEEPQNLRNQAAAALEP
jgi:hypothetical protein